MAERFAWLNAAVSVQDFCRRKAIPFAFIGGVAVQRWGEPRVTQDVDLTLYVGFGCEEPIVDAFLEEFAGRLPDAREFALSRRVLLLRSSEGIGIDAALGGFPFEAKLTRRARLEEFYPGVHLTVCTAEDLIVLKSFAGRPQDWIDVERVITRQAGKLDWEYIRAELKPLAELKECPEILAELERHRRIAER